MQSKIFGRNLSPYICPVRPTIHRDVGIWKPLSFVRFTGNPESIAINKRAVSCSCSFKHAMCEFYRVPWNLWHIRLVFLYAGLETMSISKIWKRASTDHLCLNVTLILTRSSSPTRALCWALSSKAPIAHILSMWYSLSKQIPRCESLKIAKSTGT